VPCVWEPLGPLPAPVYWRRRVLAVAVAGGAIALAGSVVSAAGPEQPAALASGPPTPSGPSAQPAPVAPPPGPPTCADSMIGVTAGLDADQHRVGDKPVLRLIVVNTSAQPCVRDVDPARQEITIWSDDLRDRIWSSNDCASTAPRPDQRTLLPNQPVAFPVRWAGRTSAAGCPAERADVPAGAYRLRGRLDGVSGEPTPFHRVP
jgi:hypothetical protein